MRVVEALAVPELSHRTEIKCSGEPENQLTVQGRFGGLAPHSRPTLAELLAQAQLSIEHHTEFLLKPAVIDDILASALVNYGTAGDHPIFLSLWKGHRRPGRF